MPMFFHYAAGFQYEIRQVHTWCIMSIGLQTGRLGFDIHATKYPPSTHMEYVLVKSAGPKVLRAESRAQGTGEYFPPLQFPCQNCGGRDRWCRHLSSHWGISPS
ncbi:hypothetical protein TNCV_2005761 [Trichonephila clavipes]|nr:hypothetical protein TNCV_2005761 [Trichonephila clavipes]